MMKPLILLLFCVAAVAGTRAAPVKQARKLSKPVPASQDSNNGILLNVPFSSLGAWSLCYDDVYSDSLSPANVLSQCGQQYLMLACAPNGASALTVAAWALRSDVATFTQGSYRTANGANWYFGSGSWGFFPVGDDVQLNVCDVATADGAERLCWHTSGEGGYRCGLNTALNWNSNWQRLVLQSNYPTFVNTSTSSSGWNVTSTTSSSGWNTSTASSSGGWNGTSTTSSSGGWNVTGSANSTSTTAWARAATTSPPMSGGNTTTGNTGGNTTTTTGGNTTTTTTTTSTTTMNGTSTGSSPTLDPSACIVFEAPGQTGLSGGPVRSAQYFSIQLVDTEGQKISYPDQYWNVYVSLQVAGQSVYPWLYQYNGLVGVGYNAPYSAGDAWLVIWLNNVEIGYYYVSFSAGPPVPYNSYVSYNGNSSVVVGQPAVATVVLRDYYGNIVEAETNVSLTVDVSIPDTTSWVGWVDDGYLAYIVPTRAYVRYDVSVLFDGYYDIGGYSVVASPGPAVNASIQSDGPLGGPVAEELFFSLVLLDADGNQVSPPYPGKVSVWFTPLDDEALFGMKYLGAPEAPVRCGLWPSAPAANLTAMTYYYGVTYGSTLAGSFELSVALDGVVVTSAIVGFTAGPADNRATSAQGTGISIAYLDEVASFTVESKDAYGNVNGTYDGLAASVEDSTGAAVAKVFFRDNQDGTYTGEYLVSEPGPFWLSVSIDNESICGSPFLVTVESCAGQSSCGSCAAAGCTWCLDTNSCSTDNTTCVDTIRDPQYCPESCAAFETCNSCVSAANAGVCSFCLDTNSCVPFPGSACSDRVSKSQYCPL